MASVIDSVVNLCKRRGLVYPCGEIYGGTRSAWDYGPLGVELKENIKKQWWRTFVQGRADMVGLDSSIILPRQVWEASGHVETFTDPLVESLHTHKRYRADHLLEAYKQKHGHPPANGLADVPDPETGQPGAWTEPQMFSGLMKTFLGPVDNEQGLHYMRPETAQGIFINFKNVQTTARMKPPFGIGQVGKAFRNEITPGNFIFRTREFEQMEIEYFVSPSDAPEKFQEWVDACWDWFIDLGINVSSTFPKRSVPTIPQAPLTSNIGSGSPVVNGANSWAWPTVPTTTWAPTSSIPARTCPTSIRSPGSAMFPMLSNLRSGSPGP